MAQYDMFLNKNHPSWLTSMLQKTNDNILQFLLSQIPDRKALSILELGPGKGYFYQSVRNSKLSIDYRAIDQNTQMLSQLHAASVYKSTLPKIPKIKKRFDIVYAAYVIEHLTDGRALYTVIQNCKRLLKPGGAIVFLVPNVLSQKLEFWNADYTHSYPTTKRNVTMAFLDNGITDVTIHDVLDISLWATSNPMIWKIFNVIPLVLFWYNYHLVSFFLSLFLGQKPHDMGNWFYRIYNFTQAKSLLFVALK